jgi:hypothetical protein
MPERINGGLAAGGPMPPNKAENSSDLVDGHYHYPGLAEEGYSGNTGRAVQPNRKESFRDIPLNRDTINYTRYHR